MEIKSTHPFLASFGSMQEFVAPLKKYHVDYFTYSRMGMDNSRIYLSTHPKALEDYLIHKWYLQGNTEAPPTSYQEQCVLWSTLPNQQVFQVAKRLGIDHGIFFIKPHTQYCEFFGFASTAEHFEVVNYYLSNQDFFRNFILDFKQRGKRLIEEAQAHQIYLPYESKGVPPYKIVDFNVNIPNDIKLSPRQRDCIQLLIKGASIKQIAKSLNISDRTVEDHIDALKRKFYAANKTALIIKLVRYLY